MAKRYYFDTSIWRDLFEERGMKGMLAAALISKIAREDDRIFYSSIILRELHAAGYPKDEIKSKFRQFKEILIFADFDYKELGKARDIASKRNLPKRDVMHALIALRNKCIVIAHDKHFQRLTDIAKTKKPEEIIEDHISSQAL